ncbi:hypothetical protein ColLi_06517 [Colletotrichum liriopes]|uniref:Uncharacterized protein n=1 Tax=Colletotrichum liriopes TaxID=708192 RepID=A0AA37LSX2_9PEZI|nr:hypothetical protein ColLi_06517 [Colletotrichum liriopes]
MIPVAYIGHSPQIQGLFFIGLIVGTLVSKIFFSGKLSDWLVVRLAKRNGGGKTAEMRMWLAYPAALLTSGVSIDKAYHWMVGQVDFALSVITFCAVLLNLSAFIDPFYIAP